MSAGTGGDSVPEPASGAAGVDSETSQHRLPSLRVGRTWRRPVRSRPAAPAVHIRKWIARVCLGVSRAFSPLTFVLLHMVRLRLTVSSPVSNSSGTLCGSCSEGRWLTSDRVSCQSPRKRFLWWRRDSRCEGHTWAQRINHKHERSTLNCAMRCSISTTATTCLCLITAS